MGVSQSWKIASTRDHELVALIGVVKDVKLRKIELAHTTISNGRVHEVVRRVVVVLIAPNKVRVIHRRGARHLTVEECTYWECHRPRDQHLPRWVTGPTTTSFTVFVPSMTGSTARAADGITARFSSSKDV